MEDTCNVASEPSSSDTNSPLPALDQWPSMSMGMILSGALANAEGFVDAWAELKVRFKFYSPILMLIRVIVYLAYFEVQFKSIIYVIQTFSSGPHSHILANALRKPCTNHHYCFIHRRRMQRKPPTQPLCNRATRSHRS
jgi:hypothetical protein